MNIIKELLVRMQQNKIDTLEIKDGFLFVKLKGTLIYNENKEEL